MVENYWVRWCSRDMGKFKLDWPWWISGHAMGFDQAGEPCENSIIVAAIRARDELHVRNIINASHDDPEIDIEFDFIDEKAADWTPYNDRFKKIDWMPEWPPSMETITLQEAYKQIGKQVSEDIAEELRGFIDRPMDENSQLELVEVMAFGKTKYFEYECVSSQEELANGRILFILTYKGKRVISDG